VIQTILSGILAGLAYSLTAFAKTSGEKFDWLKFGVTVTIGAAAGVVMVFAKMPIDAANAFLIQLGAVPIVENLLKIGYRKVWPKVQAWFS